MVSAPSMIRPIRDAWRRHPIQTGFLVLCALLFSEARASTRLCAALMAGRAASETDPSRPAQALARAWEELLIEGLASEREAAVREWLASLDSSSGLQAWLSPGEGVFPFTVDAGFEQLRAFFEAAAESAGSDAGSFRGVVLSELRARVEEQRERDQVVEAAADARLEKRMAAVDESFVQLDSYVSRSPDLAELPDGRILALGFGADAGALSFLAPDPLLKADAIPQGRSLHEGGRGISGTVVPLPGGGFVVATQTNAIAFFSESGERFAIHSTTEWTTGNESRPIVLADGTVAYVNQFNQLHLFDSRGTPRAPPISLPATAWRTDPIALRDGTIGVVAGRLFVVFDPAGNRVAEHEGYSTLTTQPVELNDGAVLIGGEDGYFAILARAGGGFRFDIEAHFELGRRYGVSVPVELAGGQIAVSSGGRLAFFDRTSRRLNWVPVLPTEHVAPAALPDGGVAVVSSNRLVLFDADGTSRNGSGSLPETGEFNATPAVVSLPGTVDEQWGVLALTARGIVLLDENGALLVDHAIERAFDEAQLVRLKVLSDGTILTGDSRGRITRVRLNLERLAKGLR